MATRGVTAFTVSVGGTNHRHPSASTRDRASNEIWPPNHQLVAIDVLGVSDPDGNAVSMTIASIRQDEPVNRGRRSVHPRRTGVGTATAKVRAERMGGSGEDDEDEDDGKDEHHGKHNHGDKNKHGSKQQARAKHHDGDSASGDGRVYHIAFTADDGSGGTCSGEVLVRVPHDQRHAVIDDGPRYDSTLAEQGGHANTADRAETGDNAAHEVVAPEADTDNGSTVQPDSSQTGGPDLGGSLEVTSPQSVTDHSNLDSDGSRNSKNHRHKDRNHRDHGGRRSR